MVSMGAEVAALSDKHRNKKEQDNKFGVEMVYIEATAV